jgi:hypothetical protein
MEGIKRFPTVAELYYRMGVLFMDKNQRKEAFEWLSKALEMDFSKHQDIFDYAPVLLNDKEILSLITAYKK